MGGSGCGKSTVRKAMIRVAPPDDRDSFGGRRRLLGCQRNAPAGNRTPVWRPVSGRRALEFADTDWIRLPPTRLTVRQRTGFRDRGQARGPVPRACASRPKAPTAFCRRQRPFPRRRVSGQPECQSHQCRDAQASVAATPRSRRQPSLFAICDDGIFLDGETGTAIAHGSPRALRDGCTHPTVRAFMERGQRAPVTVAGAP